MRLPQFHGSASAELSAEDDGSRPCIWLEVVDDGAGGNWPSRSAHAALNVESAVRLAEQLDAAIDLYARTERARKEAREARISALRATLQELTGTNPNQGHPS